jgi:opacity protein-like surface antigen
MEGARTLVLRLGLATLQVKNRLKGMTEEMKFKWVFSFVFLLFFFTVATSLAQEEKKRGPIILGFGGGYSFFLDSGLRSYEVFHPKLIYFSERLNLTNNFNLYAQYFPWLGFGFQLEFDHQRANYHSDLNWYGHAEPDGEITRIDHIEEPYKETWSMSSITASILYALTLRANEKMRPYISAGIGYYFSSGDEDRFYNRTRLGPEKSGNLVKLGLGVKYKISPRIAINLKGVGGTVWRREYGYGEILYVGSEQFDYAIYVETGKLVRREILHVNSFTYLGVQLSLEFTL